MLIPVHRQIALTSEIMKDIATTVDHQGEVLEVVSANVEKARDNVKETNKELKEANDMNKSSNRCM